ACTNEQTLVEPLPRVCSGFKARDGSEIHARRVYGFPADQGSNVLGCSDTYARVFDINAIAVCCFNNVARLNIGEGVGAYRLKVRPTWQNSSLQLGAIHRATQ